jgi:uncharacterized repeat protein (TIGR03803 family)
MGTDGHYPRASLIFDAAANIYGTTSYGGSGSCGDNGVGCGAVFELTPKVGGGWTERVLYSFKNNGKDGNHPYAGLIFDAAGNLYGTTLDGGVYDYGTVFELTPQKAGTWTEKVLHSFNNNYKDGVWPYGGLIFDAAGNLYGTTADGGGKGYGTVFELAPEAAGRWKEKILHNFSYNGKDGYAPYASLIFDSVGNLYGTTLQGGTYGTGTVFELMPQAVAAGRWREKILHNFNYNGKDGYYSNAGLILSAAGNLYGTTRLGGAYNYGTVFELTPKVGGGWTEKVLHNFNFNGKDGFYPYAGLILDAGDNLYGTTSNEGYGVGAVFELTPKACGSWKEKVLHNFNYTNGNYPYGGVILDSAGNLYGTTTYGGTKGGGTVFEITP